MRITIIQDDGMVGVDGVFRAVDLAELDPAIRAIQFDTARGVGHVEYDRGATIDVDVRDHAAERAAEEAAAGDREAIAALQPIFKKVPVPRDNDELDAESFAPFQKFVDAWQAWTPPAPPVPSAEELAARDREAKRAAALRALDDKRLGEAMLDPLAPQAVKDYQAVLEFTELPSPEA